MDEHDGHGAQDEHGAPTGRDARDGHEHGDDDVCRVVTDAQAQALIGALRAGGSVFAEDELAVLREHAETTRWVDAYDLDVHEKLELYVDRRVHGERIEHITERAPFAELTLSVPFGVFVPRRRTELLATVVATRLGELATQRGAAGPRPRLLDFGCGAGPIAALAAHRVPTAEIVAVDCDEHAVACARENLPGALVVQASSIEALVGVDASRASAVDAGMRGSTDAGATDATTDASRTDPTGGTPASAPFDVIAANLPYVPTEQLLTLPHGTLESEPRVAFDGGDQGLDVIGEHVLSMFGSLREGGFAVVELAPHQVELAIEIFELTGFSRVEIATDDELDATILIAHV